MACSKHLWKGAVTGGRLPAVLSGHVRTGSGLFYVRSMSLHFSGKIRHACRQVGPDNHRTIVVIPVARRNSLLLIQRCTIKARDCRLKFPGNLVSRKRSPLRTTGHRLGRRVNFNSSGLAPLGRLILTPSCFSDGVALFVTRNLCPRELRNSRPRPLSVIQ